MSHDTYLQLPTLGTNAVTSWLPDETLFSLCSRYHVIVGNVLARTTCSVLFGHPQRGAQHDLPSRLDEFVKRTEGCFGDVQQIITQHTLLPFYLPWKSLQQQADTVATCRGEGLGSLKYRLGLLTSRFGANHPLKACPQCMREDVQYHDVSYWHRIHQLPGMWVCPVHREWLLVSNVKSTGVGRFLWFLPTTAILSPPSPTNRMDTSAATVTALGTLSMEATNLPLHSTIHPIYLRQAYLERLEALDLRVGNRLKLETASHAFLESLFPLRCIPELEALPSSLTEAESQLGRLLRRSDSLAHPLRHLAIIMWLFKSWEDFWTTYQKLNYKDVRDDCSSTISIFPPEKRSDLIGRRKSFIDLIQSGKSIHSAAKDFGIDTNTAMAWAAKENITIKRRPKKINPEIREKLINELRQGCAKKILADRYDLSIQTITTTLRTEPGLQQEWHAARERNARNEKRRLLEAVRIANPSFGIKAIRLLEPGAYAWLYRNDRAWLIQFTSSLPPLSLGNNSKVDWDRRDHELALLVKNVAIMLVEQIPNRRLTLQLIYQHAPSLRPKLSKLERLPLTHRMLNEVLSCKFLASTDNLPL
ncbi:hypothetical protein DB032_19610 [Chromobacterium sp. Panama]|uniref:TnsD family Tn7-like transposition protein n=1 Tax=Chromobacterium sp. Panama TaxID=2161826 RepID=UPI000D2FC812|nr:TnsD family Tn7-like transposition protein [Chromobacterium sp. Panama]PTU66971.1 hypothetical protein DB032_19610 [Chromobacterium sp. Panama]